jgi:hypothetical protein
MWPKKLKFTKSPDGYESAYILPSDELFEVVGDVPQLPVVMPGTGTPTSTMSFEDAKAMWLMIAPLDRCAAYFPDAGRVVAIDRQTYDDLLECGFNVTLLRIGE